MDPPDENRKRHVDLGQPGSGSGSSLRTSTSHTTSTSTSRSFGMSGQPRHQDLYFDSPHHSSGSSFTYGSGSGGGFGFGQGGTMMGSGMTYGSGSTMGGGTTTTWSSVTSTSPAGFPSTWPPPPSEQFKEFERRSNLEMEKAQRRALIIMSLMLTVIVGVFLLTWLYGGGDDGTEETAGAGGVRSSWSFGIYVGPFWIGFG